MVILPKKEQKIAIFGIFLPFVKKLYIL